MDARLMSVKFLCLLSTFALSAIRAQAGMVQQKGGKIRYQTYEDKADELITELQLVKSSWTPQINKDFVGKDFDSLTRLGAGIDSGKMDRKLKNAKQSKRKPPPPKKKKDRKQKQQQQQQQQQQKQQQQDDDNRRRLRSKRYTDNLPENFDWRKETACKSFRHIRTQTCGDCWAVSSAATISDRYCLYTYNDRYFSARSLVSCVYGTKGGCNGGWPEDCMNYYVRYGLASGGDPALSEEQPGCLPYPASMTNAIQCSDECDDGSYLDLTRGGEYEIINSTNVDDIQQEIYVYGSVVAIFEVFEDFYVLGTGVYQHLVGVSLGWHAVRLLGWGVENGLPYWLAANQWGPDFGEDGFFKILRGSNHCSIEKAITAVYPSEAWS